MREAFINALVHTDYALSGNIVIKLDTEEFVFSNPGTLLVSIEQYYAGGISECRNPALQQMFMLIGRAEKAGSGVDKIMSGWRESHWRKPFLELEMQPDRVKLTMPMFNVIPDSVLDELDSLFNDVNNLSADELTVLSFCLIEGSISNHRLQYVLNKHSVDITALLKKLCESGYLESNNNGRWTTYKINRIVATSGANVATSDANVATSGANVATSDANVATSDKKRTRLNKEELELRIMQICKKNYVKKEDIATSVGKSADYLKNIIFPQMIKDGKLEKHFPFTHNHPEQGYKTTEEYAKEL